MINNLFLEKVNDFQLPIGLIYDRFRWKWIILLQVLVRLSAQTESPESGGDPEAVLRFQQG